MTKEQRNALAELSRRTDLGRSGQDATPQCAYGIDGVENGITLMQSGIGDSEMRYFEVLPEFEVITLRGNDITNVGLVHLARQKHLWFLDLGVTQVTSLGTLSNLTALKILYCDELFDLGDSGTAGLEKFVELDFLEISCTKVGDATLRRLSLLRRLKKLNLSWTKITDEGLPSLTGNESLEVLGLCDTAISDRGLEVLHAFPRLRILALGMTQTTAAARERVQKAIPGLVIQEYWSRAWND